MKDSVGVAPTVEEQRKTARVGGLSAARDRISLLGLAAGLIPFAVAFSVYLLVFAEMRPLGATGDEPHYLITAESIAYDLDVDLTNDYANRDRVLRVVNVFPLGPHAAVYKDSGELRPFRGVALPLLLAPGIRLGGLTGARLVMVLIAALFADQLYRLLRDLRFRRRYRILAWVSVVFCLPVLVFTSQIYPELPGALLVLVALRVMVAGGSRPAALALGSTAAAALVWLHVRFLSLSVGILAGLTIAACVHGWSAGRSGGLRGTVSQARAAALRCFAVLTKRWRTVTLPILAPYVIGLGLLSALYQHWYGSPNLQKPYQAFGSPAIGSGGWDFWYEFAVRDILDPKVGWIPFAPVHWLGLALLGCLVVWFGRAAAAVVVVAAGYVLLVASVGPNVGWGFPGRYPLIVIPLIAVPIAVGIQKLRTARIVFVPLLAVSIVFAVAAVRDWGLLYPAERQQIFGLRSTATAFPVPVEPQPPEAFTHAPGDWPVPQTGRLEQSQVVAKPGRDRPGFLRYGPYVVLKSGAYQSTFSLAARGAGTDEPVAVIEVLGLGESVLARKLVTSRQLRPGLLSGIDLPFATPGLQPIETRVYYLGRGTLRAGSIEVRPIEAAVAETHFRDWPLTFLWVGGTVLIGWLFVEVMKLNRRRVTSSDGDSALPAGAGEPPPH